MSDLWSSLIPLVLASAILPLQIAVTVLLAGASAGPAAAMAWVAGMLVVRLGQGVLFGLVLGQAAAAEDPAGPRLITSTLLLVVGVVLLVSAVRAWLQEPEDDTPSPRWMAVLASATPGRAFLAGAGVVAVSVKLWVFTLGAIGAIAEADLAPTSAAVVYLAFTAAALSIHLSIVGVAIAWPSRAAALLGGIRDALERNARPLKIGLGIVFGTWFLLKALDGLGVPGPWGG